MLFLEIAAGVLLLVVACMMAYVGILGMRLCSLWVMDVIRRRNEQDKLTRDAAEARRKLEEQMAEKHETPMSMQQRLDQAFQEGEETVYMEEPREIELGGTVPDGEEPAPGVTYEVSYVPDLPDKGE